MTSSFDVEYKMNGVVLHADHTETLASIAKLLFENSANAIIVREAGVPVGIVTSKDILKGLFEIDKDPKETSAKDIMSTPVVCVNHNDSLAAARSRMLGKGIRKLAVVKNFEIIGLLVETDILRDLEWVNHSKEPRQEF